MTVNDNFNFGINKGLTLKQIYQGTAKIDEKQFQSFLVRCLNAELVPKPDEFLLCEFKIFENEIEIIPEIFDVTKPYSKENQVYLGNLSEKIEIYFNHFFKPNWFGIIENLQNFNSGNYVIGGNPEYILWSINKVKNFNIDLTTLRELEKLTVYRLKGIKVEMTNLNQYKYKTVIEEEFYKFKMQLIPIPTKNENTNYECDFPF